MRDEAMPHAGRGNASPLQLICAVCRGDPLGRPAWTRFCASVQGDEVQKLSSYHDLASRRCMTATPISKMTTPMPNKISKLGRTALHDAPKLTT
mgnify:CR=1 FL=1